MHTMKGQYMYSDSTTKLEQEGVTQTAILGQRPSLTSPVVAPQTMVMKLKNVNRPVYWFARLCCGDKIAPPAIAD